ncbi:cellulose biosynthesis protein BcsF [Martelella alba]|uniref:Cellulose biosynthesis protein BcsF n=1 Tax=Martelella alba TaxID=2590451 RepID=A0ABY2SR50_9HYPH|nr:cellulose biosynthesis protein BcsF [Martelella alba]TKI07810.1 cellulose biosynthesis protein BcsF [Martelella alba]
MNLDDIWQLTLLCAAVFFPLGYLFHRRFPFWFTALQSWLLSPRYLKSAGIWIRDEHRTDKDTK